MWSCCATVYVIWCHLSRCTQDHITFPLNLQVCVNLPSRVHNVCVCEYVSWLLVRPVWMTCLSNVWAKLWIAPGRESKRRQDFNPANSLSVFGFGKTQPAPSQFSPCVGERRSGLFTFPLCAKLSWFLAMNKMHTRSDAHACTQKHPHRLPCSVFIISTDGEFHANNILQFGFKIIIKKNIHPPMAFCYICFLIPK